jgi:nucleoside-diphosphate-sugar epimerase
VSKLPVEDLEHVLAHTKELWSELNDRRIFITGGTGFFGCWLLESLTFAIDRLNLNIQAVVLTRDIPTFQLKAPHLAEHSAIMLYQGDVRDFTFPDGEFSHVIHGATAASASLNSNDPLLMIDTIVTGTKHTLEFAKQKGVKKFLLTSSGAVYGRQPVEISHVSENYFGAPDPMNPANAYGEAKRLAELLCTIASHESQVETKIARCFAFVGPHLPLDTHFAIGNFIRDGLQHKPIHIRGDGTPYRSYLYAADLAIWLWTILFKGKSCQPYNVGSDVAITIGGLGKLITEVLGSELEVIIDRQPVPGKAADRYVPAIQTALLDLQLQPYIDLPTSIKKTADWYRALSIPSK